MRQDGLAEMWMKVVPLDWLLEYELQAAERYRRYVALVLIRSTARWAQLREQLAQSLRASDAIIPQHGATSIVMTDTEIGGALVAVERLKKACCCDKAETYFAVAIYPQDGVLSDNLLVKAQLRLEKARSSVPGTVICSDL